MKKLLFILFTAFIFTACATTNEAGKSRAEIRHEKDLVNQALVKQAVESRRFIVKLDRMYLTGGMVHLKPRANYIIVDGSKAIINAAYMGRQWDIRPIAGINMRGVSSDFELTNQVSKGIYKISMKVGNNSSTFDVYMTIGKDGSVNASLNNVRIQNIRYTGYIVPISDRNIPLQNYESI
jgi:uncharacterized lipoprotein YajG